MAIIPKSSSDFAKVFEYFTAHKAQCLQKQNFKDAVYDLRLLAIIQNESGFYYDIEISAIEALTMLNEMSDNAYSQEN